MIIVIGLLIAFILVLLFTRRDMRQCRWRRTGAADSEGQMPYKCAACGARALTTTGKAPLVCKINPRS